MPAGRIRGQLVATIAAAADIIQRVVGQGGGTLGAGVSNLRARVHQRATLAATIPVSAGGLLTVEDAGVPFFVEADSASTLVFPNERADLIFDEASLGRRSAAA